jgi:hypothetical protein
MFSMSDVSLTLHQIPYVVGNHGMMTSTTPSGRLLSDLEREVLAAKHVINRHVSTLVESQNATGTTTKTTDATTTTTTITTSQNQLDQVQDLQSALCTNRVAPAATTISRLLFLLETQSSPITLRLGGKQMPRMMIRLPGKSDE